MNFLSPAFLVALAAAAIPLIIHLLNRRRVPEVPFSSLMFLGRASRRSMRRVDLRRLLLLLMRTVAIALIALAFARPVIEGSLAALFPGDAPRAVVIMVDRSYSMGVRESGGTVFENALDAAERIAANVEDADEITLALFDEAGEAVYSSARLPAEGAGAITGGLETSWRGTDIAGALDFARNAVERSGLGAGEIFIVSDLQRTGIQRTVAGAGPDERAGEAPAPAVPDGLEGGFSGGGGGAESGPSEKTGVPARVFIVPVTPGPGANVAVQSVSVPAATVHVGETVRIEAKLRNTSPDLEARVPVRLSVEGSLVADREIAIPPEESRVETFEFTARGAGWVTGEVGCREDRLPADDVRRFALLVRERSEVLLLAGGGDLYLKQALSPGGYEGDIVPSARSWRDYTSGDLERADAVIAGPGGSPGKKDAALLLDFAEKGGRVVVFVTEESADLAEEMSRWKPSISFRTGALLSPGRPEGGSAILEPLSGPEAEEFLRIEFRDPPEIEGLPARDVLLGFEDGTPLIWVEERGEGEVIFAAVDPVPAGGDLPLSPWFLPLVQQLVLAPARGGRITRSALVGSTVSLDSFHPEGCEALLPGGDVYTAGGPDSEGSFVFPAGPLPGFITAVCAGDTIRRIAVNPDCRRESELDYMSAAEAADSLGVSAWAGIKPGAGMGEELERARRGKEISGWLLAAALVLLAAELAVSQRPAGRTGT